MVAAVDRSQVMSSISVITFYFTSESLIAFGTSESVALGDNINELDRLF